MTKRSWFSQASRLALLGGATLALVASTEAGDRAGADGRCPAGETCSPLTPEGLLFEGAPLGFWPALTAHTIAAGGRQSFRITDKATGAPLALPFTAVTSSPFSIVGQGEERAVVAASEVGTGYLRIVSPEGELYDRVSIDSAEVASMRLAPTYAEAYPQLDPPRWAALAGGRAQVAVVLATADDRWLVDEDLAVRSAVALERIGWDAVALSPTAAGEVELAVDAGHLTDQRVRLPVVDTIAAIDATGPAQSGVGGEVTVCFQAWAGPGPDAVRVIGVPWRFELTGPAVPLDVQPYRSCLAVRPTADGQVTLRALAGGREATHTITVRGAAMRAASRSSWLFAGTDGERAAMGEP